MVKWTRKKMLYAIKDERGAVKFYGERGEKKIVRSEKSHLRYLKRKFKRLFD
jgi:hypothetical protein